MEESFEALEQHLQSLIETSRQLGIMASDFQQNSQSVLNQKFSFLSFCLKDLDQLKGNFENVQVPISVFNYIDEGKNPLLYTKDCLLKTLKKNEEIKGKIVTFKAFRELLLNELNKNFPDEYESYVKVREGEKAAAVSESPAPATEKKAE